MKFEFKFFLCILCVFINQTNHIFIFYIGIIWFVVYKCLLRHFNDFFYLILFSFTFSSYFHKKKEINDPKFESNLLNV